MKILFTSDIHAHSRHLFSMLEAAETEQAEALIVGGDIIPHYLPGAEAVGVLKAQGRYLETVLIPALETFKKKRPIPVYIDIANDDYAWNRQALERHDGGLLRLIHMKKRPLTDKTDLIGYMIVPPTPFGRKDWEKPDSRKQPVVPDNPVMTDGVISRNGRIERIAFDLASPDTIEKDLDILSETIEKPFIFVAHSPPHDTPLDIVSSGRHAGSIAIRQFIEKWSGDGRLVASLHGHIHESPERSGRIAWMINNRPCVNPGQDSSARARFRCALLELNEEHDPPEITIISSVS